MVMSLVDALRMGLRLRTFITERNVYGVAAYSQDISSQVMPQALEMLLAASGAGARVLIDGRTGLIERIGRFGWLGTTGRLPADLAQAVALTVRESRRAIRNRTSKRLPTALVLDRRPLTTPSRSERDLSCENWILVIWPASRDLLVGGAVTHVSGILGGFRSAGYRIALVVMVGVGEQVASSVDEIVVPAPLIRGARITRGMECLGMNEALREAALDIGRRVRPAFVYQRHEYLSTAGADVASALGIPLVLEWNASAVWAWSNLRRSANVPRLIRVPIRRFAVAVERRAVTDASLVVAVSEPAATMAYEANAPTSAVVVVPNGVDLAEIDRAMEPKRPLVHEAGPLSKSNEHVGHNAVVGWVGSFGTWHGTDTLVHALAMLPVEIRAVMIGTGPALAACQTLARELGVYERIEFTGELPHAEAVRRLAESDVLVSPHVNNFDRPFFGSPTKIFEYMAIGRPIVASRLEQIGEILEDGVTARLVPPGDVPALASTILDLLESDDRGGRIATNARRTAEDHHSWTSRAALVLDALEARRRPMLRPPPSRSSTRNAPK
jgi:glycosyltransferase involved in cell wall biosynthesis